MALTNATKAAVLDALYGGATLDVPNKLYIGLSTTQPNPDGTNFTEPVGNAYERVELSNDATTWNDATVNNPSVKTNKIPILFNEATGPWGTITHWGIFDAAEGGNLLDWAPVLNPTSVGEGQQAQFRAGDLQTRLQDA